MKKIFVKKAPKLLVIGIITLLSAFLSSCQKDDFNEHSLDNTYWVSPLSPNNLIGYALSFNNGYVQSLYLDHTTKHVLSENFAGKYFVKGEKIVVTRDYPGRASDVYEATYRKGVIYFSGIYYYLQ